MSISQMGTLRLGKVKGLAKVTGPRDGVEFSIPGESSGPSALPLALRPAPAPFATLPAPAGWPLAAGVGQTDRNRELIQGCGQSSCSQQPEATLLQSSCR